MDSRPRRGGFGLPGLSSFQRRAALGLSALGLLLGAGVPAHAAEGASSARGIIDQLLSFLYSSGHLVGQGIMRLVHTILPSISIDKLDQLVDPVGLLAILTAFLVVVSIAKRLAWIVVIAGWVLIVVRLVMVIVEHSV
ncbi:MAG: hypothetical protein NT125_05435 [Candidatus Bipolaricaulota bacterium]|nr:hypothetical protein [Candidatus Bipolaricaulota bacterium]